MIRPSAGLAFIVLMVAVFPLSPCLASAAQSPSLLWKAKALESFERLGSLEDALKKVANRWNSSEAKRLRCESMMETAFASHVHPDLAPTVHKTGDGLEFFKVVLNGGENGLFDLTYVYDGNTHRATKVMMLPRGWEVIFPTEAKEIGFLVIPGACTIAVDFSDPFFYRVIEK
jgi:hypothetical protein